VPPVRRDGVANQERILAAAEDVFGRSGSGASTEEVARVAGVGVATVFRHFPTKQELLEATAVRYLATFADRVQELAAQEAPGPAVASIFRTLVATGPTKVTLLNLMLTDGDGLTETVLASVDAIRRDVGEVLRSAQDAGQARADVTVEHVFTLARALAHVSPPDADAMAADVVLDGLGVRR
jgi:AcrR family transcriptional regulator